MFSHANARSPLYADIYIAHPVCRGTQVGKHCTMEKTAINSPHFDSYRNAHSSQRLIGGDLVLCLGGTKDLQ